MKFNKVIGEVDEKLVQQAEEKLSSVFLELGTSYTNDHVGTGLGGDPLIFTLLYPMEHICTLNIPTAGTDGKRYYWNPKFVMKQSKIGLRIVCAHEAWHAIYMHPQRRGSRLPKLWNIAVDYIVNGAVGEDFSARKHNAADLFQKNLGSFYTLEQYAELLKDPFAAENAAKLKAAKPVPKFPKPDDDRPLTAEEIKDLEDYERRSMTFFFDPDLKEDMKSPEKIYNYLYSLLPKCDTCGRVGVYKKPQKDQDQKSAGGKDKGDQQSDSSEKGKKGKKGKKPSNDQHDHGDGDPCDCGDGQSQNSSSGNDESCEHGCPSCGDGQDIFDLGDTLDEHMDSEESEEKLAKRVSDAMEAAKKMAGRIPASLEDELGKLTAPKIVWQDVIRSRMIKARAGNSRNDWTKGRTRPMFAGLYVPKKRSNFSRFACLIDQSGSMSNDDIAFGLSQLQAIDDRAEGTLVPADCEIYWDKALKIKNCKAEELLKLKRVAGGGTSFAGFFSDYKRELKEEQDFLVIITDAYLLDTDIAEMKDPGIDVFWVVTSGHESFKPPFGKVFCLKP